MQRDSELIKQVRTLSCSSVDASRLPWVAGGAQGLVKIKICRDE